MVDSYLATAKAKGLAPTSARKYETDLEKLKAFCRDQRICLAHHFGRDDYFRFRGWLIGKGYAAKTVYGVLTVTKQVFKWAHLEGKMREYRLGGAKLAKAKAPPQPCFDTGQVELIIANSEGLEKVAFATLLCRSAHRRSRADAVGRCADGARRVGHVPHPPRRLDRHDQGQG